VKRAHLISAASLMIFENKNVTDTPQILSCSRECSWPAQRGLESFDTREDDHEKTYTVNAASLSLQNILSTGLHLLGVSFTRRLGVKFMHRSNYIKHNRK